MGESRVLEVKEVQPLAEDLRLVILLDAEALACMEAPETLLERNQHVVVDWGHGSKSRPVELAGCPREAISEVIAQAPARMAPTLPQMNDCVGSDFGPEAQPYLAEQVPKPPIKMNSRWLRSSNHHLLSDAR